MNYVTDFVNITPFKNIQYTINVLKIYERKAIIIEVRCIPVLRSRLANNINLIVGSKNITNLLSYSTI